MFSRSIHRIAKTNKTNYSVHLVNIFSDIVYMYAVQCNTKVHGYNRMHDFQTLQNHCPLFSLNPKSWTVLLCTKLLEYNSLAKYSTCSVSCYPYACKSFSVHVMLVNLIGFGTCVRFANKCSFNLKIECSNQDYSMWRIHFFWGKQNVYMSM